MSSDIELLRAYFLLQGLAYLHSIFKVNNTDIKGGNILLSEQSEVKLGKRICFLQKF